MTAVFRAGLWVVAGRRRRGVWRPGLLPIIGMAAVWAARRVWPYRYGLGPIACLILIQAAASKAWEGTLRIPWPVGATPHGNGFTASGIGTRPVQLGPWVWALIALAMAGAVLAAAGAVTKHQSRHWLTIALILSVAEFGALSTLAGWQPWALIVAPVAATWWAITSPAGPVVPVRLPEVQESALAVVRSSPGVTAEQVAETVGKDRSQINRTLQALRKKGLVEATNTKPATWSATNQGEQT